MLVFDFLFEFIEGKKTSEVGSMHSSFLHTQEYSYLDFHDAFLHQQQIEHYTFP